MTITEIQNFFEYLVEHPGTLRLTGVILLTLLLLPYIIVWARAKQVSRIRKAYDQLVMDQTTTITGLYRNVMDVQGTLAKTRGELDQKIAELKNKDINLDEALVKISKLKHKISELESIEIELNKKIAIYEQA